MMFNPIFGSVRPYLPRELAILSYVEETPKQDPVLVFDDQNVDRDGRRTGPLKTKTKSKKL
jgi:hypothetical protein